MGLLSRLPAGESWPEMERAAELRYYDGWALAVSGQGRYAGAVYLIGYAVEILLKTACYREMGVSRHVGTTDRRLQIRGVYAQQLKALYGRQPNDHDLDYWAFVLERLRVAHGRSMNAALAGAIRRSVGLLAGNWRETLRYRDCQPTETELIETLACADWFLANRRCI